MEGMLEVRWRPPVVEQCVTPQGAQCGRPALVKCLCGLLHRKRGISGGDGGFYFYIVFRQWKIGALSNMSGCIGDIFINSLGDIQ